MRQTIINFREERDLGQNLNTTFGFIKQNFTKLLKCIAFFVLPFALLGGIFMGVYQSRVDLAKSGELYYRPWSEYDFQDVTSLNYIIAFFFSYISFILVCLCVYGYMVQYMDNDGEVEVRDVWENIKSNFLTAFYSSFGILILCLAGYVILLVPGIYLSVALSIFLIVMVREEVGFVEAIERSLYLIKGNWWSTFGLLLLVGLIQAMISLVASLPAFALEFMKLLELPGAENSWLAIIFNTFATVVGIAMYVITITALAFQYFNLVEIKDGIGLMQQADLIGQQTAQSASDEADF